PSHSAFACELRWGSIVSNRRPRTGLKQELMRLPRLERASQRIYLYSDSHRMGLAAAALDRGWPPVLRDQARPKIEQPPGKHARALGELLRVLHYRDVVLHVLVRPAARMSDKRELRKDEAELGEETEHLAGDHLDVVLAADDDETRNLVADEYTVGNGDLVLDAVHPLGHLEI